MNFAQFLILIHCMSNLWWHQTWRQCQDSQNVKINLVDKIWFLPYNQQKRHLELEPTLFWVVHFLQHWQQDYQLIYTISISYRSSKFTLAKLSIVESIFIFTIRCKYGKINEKNTKANSFSFLSYILDMKEIK
jgi:hypothetical protein